MRRVNRLILHLIIVLTAIAFLNGERTLLFSFNQAHVNFTQNHTNDIEVPNHHHVFDSFEEETCLVTTKLTYSIFHFKGLTYFNHIELIQKELLSSIWQPPKLV